MVHLQTLSQDWSIDPDSEGNDNVVTSAGQEQAEHSKHSRKCTHPSYSSGNSERTLSRKRLAFRKLKAQGFMTLPNFFYQGCREKSKGNQA